MYLFLTKTTKVLLSVFRRLKSIPHDDPDLTPDNWCMKQPCLKVRIASKEVIISQPLSTFWVYFLGFLTVGISWHFFIGGIVPVKSLITFEFMVWVSIPGFLLFCFLNAWHYYMFSYYMDLVLLGSWILLLCTMMAYWIYNKQGITKKLWAKGIWFSENDMLHVLLIFWMIYIATVVADRIKDYTIPALLE